MYSFMKFSITICLIIDCQTTDPRLQMCEDVSFDAAVNAHDGKGYLFKGDYYSRHSS
jgi:hypothetical protein